MLLRPTLEKHDVRFATTEPDIALQRGIKNADTLPDCNQNRPFRALLCAFVALWVVLKHRPHIVLSTGAAPGFFCLNPRLQERGYNWLYSKVVAGVLNVALVGPLAMTR